jgi:hypothetical protein
MMVEGEERCLPKSNKAYVAPVLQGFPCMMLCLAKSDKAYVASVLQGFHCTMVDGERETKLMLLLCCRDSTA